MIFSETHPIYMQIAEYVCEQILFKKWKPCERVLSVRELAASLEVNPNTVLRSYDFLQGMNIIINKRGIGYFVADDAIDRIKEFRREHFFKEELPLLFRNMQLLDIQMKDIEKEYNTFKNITYEKENQ